MKNSIYIFLFFFPLYVLSMGGHGYGGVGTTTYEVTRSILLYRSFAVSQVPWGKFGSNGQFYAQYGIGHSLYNIPFYSIGHGLTKLFPALSSQYDRVTMFFTLLGQPFISALTCSLLFLLCQRIGFSLKTSTQCALFYGLGTQVWMYAQLDFSEPILTFFLLGAVYWIYPNCGENAAEPGRRSITSVPLPWWEGLGEGEQGTQISGIPRTFTESLASCSPPPNLPHQGGGTLMLMTLGLGEGEQRHLILSSLFFGIAVTVKIASLILLPLFLLYILYAPYTKALSRLKNMVLFVIPVLVFGTGTVGVYNFIRFGSLFETGYDNEFNFWYKHILQQFWNNLLSLEGSIFFYSPMIVLVLFGAVTFYKKFKAFALFIFGIILTFFLFYPFTTNELYYGPRYLTPTLPFFLLIAGATFARIRKPSQGSLSLKLRKWGITVLLILGIFQQLLGVVVNYHTYYWRIHYTMPVVDEAVRSSSLGKALLATPKLPHILGHLWLVKRAVLDLFQPGGIPLTGVKLLSDSTQHNAWIPYYGLDLWWCNPNVIRMTGWVFSGMIVVVLLGMMGLALYKLTRIRC